MTATPGFDRPYPMDNRNRHSGDHHAALAELLDPDTHHLLSALRSPDGRVAMDLSGWAGATCLDVGAGAGSVALHLANAVGDTGMVVATDREVDQIPPHPRLRVVEHDLEGAEPLPPGPYHLIHARLVLAHLPERETVLDRLVARLAPGGTILLEDWAPLRAQDQMVISAPDPGAASLYGRYQQTVGAQIFDAAGTDPGWARRAHAALLTRGLVQVDTRVRASYWTGGDAGCRLVAAVLAQLRPRLLRAGMAQADLNAMLTLLTDPRLIIHGHPMYATSGRRPA